MRVCTKQRDGEELYTEEWRNLLLEDEILHGV
jgi:hypothetical protein